MVRSFIKSLKLHLPRIAGSVFDPAPKTMDELDFLGNTLLQQNLSQTKANYSFEKPV